MNQKEGTTARSSNVLLSVDEILGLVMEQESEDGNDDDDNEDDSMSFLHRSDPNLMLSVPPTEHKRVVTWHADPQDTIRDKRQEQRNRMLYEKNHHRYSPTAFQDPKSCDSPEPRPSYQTLPNSYLPQVYSPRSSKTQLVDTSIAPLTTTTRATKDLSSSSSSSWKKPTSRFEIFENNLRQEEGSFGHIF